jgi:transcriptional regulator with XRE-family HTH domain
MLRSGLMKIKNKLKEILVDKNLSQNWLAEKTELSVPTISNIVNNKTDVTLASAWKISIALRIDITDIFYDEDEEELIESYKEENINEHYKKLYHIQGMALIQKDKNRSDIITDLINGKVKPIFNVQLKEVDINKI